MRRLAYLFVFALLISMLSAGKADAGFEWCSEDPTFVVNGNLTITGTQTFSAFTFNAGNVTLDAASTIGASGTVTFTGGAFLAGTLHATGDISATSTYTGTAGTLSIEHRHAGLEAVLEYTRTKSVWIRTSDEPIADPFVMR